MRELAILTFVTLDGVMQGPGSPEEDPSGGFSHGGWAADYWDEVMAQVRREAMAEPYDMLFGRKTHAMFAGYFSALGDDDPDARKINAARKYVVTSGSAPLAWNNSIALTGDIAAEISRIKNQEGPPLQVHGSGQLIQLLLKHDLVDEFRLWIFPVLLGSGARLFRTGAGPSALRLVKTEASGNGAVMAVYRCR